MAVNQIKLKQNNMSHNVFHQRTFKKREFGNNFLCVVISIFLMACSSGKTGSQGKAGRSLINVQLDIGIKNNS